MYKKSQLLLVTPFISSFVKSDIEILSREFIVITNQYNWQQKYLTPIFMLAQVFVMLSNILKIKKIVIEFGGYWAVVPTLIGRVFRVPVFIILHGTDCASIPNVNYGSLRKYLLRLSCKFSYNFANVLLPVSSSLIQTKNDYNKRFIYQGVKYHFPKIKTPIQVINNGLDSDFWNSVDHKLKELKTFIAVFSQSQFILKGGDLIMSLAKHHKDCLFYIAGLEKPEKLKNTPNNVLFLGRLSREKLRKYYSKSQFHFQLSMYEGFGLALCEAMLCRCIPIGSSVNMIPEIIGDTGYILKKKNIKELIEIVEKALSIERKIEMGHQARERIKVRYSLDKRRKHLLSTIIETE